MPAQRFGRRGKMALVGLVFVLAFSLVYHNVLMTFQRESQVSVDNSLFKLGEQLTDGISVSCRVVSLEPSTRLMTVRLELTPLGRFALADGSLKEPLNVEASTVAGKTQSAFRAGQGASAMEFSTSLVGSATRYPFDHQQGHIEVRLTTADSRPVPLVVGGNAQVSGFRLVQGRTLDLSGRHELPEFGPGFFHVTLEISRSSTVVAFALFVMALQWLLAAVAFLVTLEVVIGGRMPDAPMFSWMTAMLFALPPMRNIMVGVPPIGVYSDYLAFLWCEGLIALCLTAVVLAWLLRRPASVE